MYKQPCPEETILLEVKTKQDLENFIKVKALNESIKKQIETFPVFVCSSDSPFVRVFEIQPGSPQFLQLKRKSTDYQKYVKILNQKKDQ